MNTKNLLSNEEELSHLGFRTSYKSYMITNFQIFDDVEVRNEGNLYFRPATIVSQVKMGRCMINYKDDNKKRRVDVDVRNIRYPLIKSPRKKQIEALRKTVFEDDKKRRQEASEINKIAHLETAARLSYQKSTETANMRRHPAKEREVRQRDSPKPKKADIEAEIIFAHWRRGCDLNRSELETEIDSSDCSLFTTNTTNRYENNELNGKDHNYARIEAMNRARVLYEQRTPEHKRLEILPSRGWLAGQGYIESVQKLRDASCINKKCTIESEIL